MKPNSYRISRIRAIIFDIDGVLTDGIINIDEAGNERKNISLSDADYVNRFKQEGFIIAAITGENTEIVRYFKAKYPWDFFISGCKNKGEELDKISDSLNISLSEICYIGDGFYDITAIKKAGLGICPSNAASDVKDVADYILQKSGGNGCISELYDLISKNRSCDTSESTKNILHSLVNRYNELSVIENDILNAYICMKNAYEKGNKVLICGNGGSSSDSEHIVGELMKSFIKQRPIEEYLSKKLVAIDNARGAQLSKKLELGLPAISLSSHESLCTAINNDIGNSLIYAQQLLTLGKQGDVLIAISTSGNSDNIINSAVLAQAMGIKVIGLTGGNGGLLSNYSDIPVVVPQAETYKIQELHLPIYHCWCMMLEEYFF